MSISRLPLALTLLVLAPAAFAATPVGRWTGKLSINLPPVPATATPQQKSQMQMAKAQIAKARFALDVKADKTYTVSMTGMPGAQGKKETGKWSQKGNVVTMTSPKNPNNTQSATLSGDGKTMTITLPGGQGKVVFTK